MIDHKQFVKEVFEMEGVYILLGDVGLVKSYAETYKKPVADEKSVAILCRRFVKLLPSPTCWELVYPDKLPVTNRRTLMSTLRRQTAIASKSKGS